VIYYRVLFTSQKEKITNQMFQRTVPKDGLWQVVAHGSRRRLVGQIPQALREHARKPPGGQKRPRVNNKDVLRAELVDHNDGKFYVEEDEGSEDGKALGGMEPQEADELFHREMCQALADSMGGAPRVAAVLVPAKDIGRELLRAKHLLDLEACKVANAKPVAPAAPVAPVASVNVGPRSLAEFMQTWGLQGYSPSHWDDFTQSMKVWDSIMSNVGSRGGLELLRLERCGRYWQAWQVAMGGKLPASILAPPVNPAPVNAKQVAVASDNKTPTYAKVVASANAAPTNAKLVPATTKSVAAVGVKMVPAAIKSVAAVDVKMVPAAIKSMVAVDVKMVPAAIKSVAAVDVKMVPAAIKSVAAVDAKAVPVVVKNTAPIDVNVVPVVVPVLPATKQKDYAKLGLELCAKLRDGDGNARALEPKLKAKYMMQAEHCGSSWSGGAKSNRGTRGLLWTTICFTKNSTKL
jgi:hypothetical protein